MPRAERLQRRRPFITARRYSALIARSRYRLIIGQILERSADWEQRVIRISNPNTGGATGLCIDVHDLALSKYAAGREQDREFNQALIRHGIVSRRKLTTLLRTMPVDDEMKGIIAARIKADYAAVAPRRASKPPKQ